MTLIEGLANFIVWSIIAFFCLYSMIIMYAQRNPDFAMWIIELAEKAEQKRQEEEDKKK